MWGKSINWGSIIYSLLESAGPHQIKVCFQQYLGILQAGWDEELILGKRPDHFVGPADLKLSQQRCF